MSYINSLSQTAYLQQVMRNQNTDLVKYQQQVSSGQKANDFSGYTPAEGRLSIAVRGSIQRNNDYQSTIGTLSTRTQNVENVLTSVHDSLTSLKNTVIALATATTTDGGASIRTTAQNALEDIIGKLNTQIDSTSLFSGRAVSTGSSLSYPIADATTIKGQVQTFIAGLVGVATPTSLNQAINQAFGLNAAGTSVTSNTNLQTWFIPGQNGAQASAVAISDDRLLASSSTALPNATRTGPVDPTTGTQIDPTYAIVDVLKVVASIAYPDSSYFAGGALSYQNYLAGQVSQMTLADKEISNLTTINGQYRRTLDDQNKALGNQTNILQQNLTTVESVDQATAITNLQNLQTQLQSTYQVTSALKGLSLANFLSF